MEKELLPDRFSAIDILCAGGLTLFMLFLLGWHYDAVPLHAMDESRNALNALEMARGGGWFLPRYGGIIDHWNTKPPLLIWMIALLMKAGVTPLLAVRLPSMLAAALTGLLAFAGGRCLLRDRLAGFVAALVILSAGRFMSLHAARAGDYDALLAFFTFAYVLSFWRAVARDGAVNIRWLAATGLLVFCAVMTKGVAGTFALAGLAAFTLLSGRLPKLLKDWRCWIVVGATGTACVGYYFIREHFDPGYLQSVWLNELGGRFAQVNERHAYGPTLYLHILLNGFQLGLALLPLSLLVLFSADRDRRSLTLLCGLCGLLTFIVITAAKTKLSWYVVPVIPLWAMAGGIGASESFRRLRARARPALRPALNGALVLGLAGGLVVAAYHQLVALPQWEKTEMLDGRPYEPLFRELRARGTLPADLIVVDDAPPNSAGFINYNPVLQFDIAIESEAGVHVTVQKMAARVPAGSFIASCDPNDRAALRMRYHLDLLVNGSCVAGPSSGE